MPTHNDQIHWIVSNARSVVALRRSSPPEFAEWCKVFPGHLRTEFFPLLLARDWNAVKARAEAELAARLPQLDQMAVRQQQLVERFRFEQTYPHIFGRSVAARKQYKELQAPTLSQINALDVMARQQLTSVAAGMLAKAVALFNQAVALPGNGTATAADCAAVEKQLLTARTSQYSALQAQDLVAVHAAGASLTLVAETALFNKVLMMAAVVATQRMSKAGSSTAGRLAMRIGDLIRALLEAALYGRWVRWVSGFDAAMPSLAKHLKAARLPLPSAYEAPASVDVADLAAQPASQDGKLVTLEGLLSNYTVVHRGRKAISSGKVSDSKGNAVTVTLPYIKFDSGGMAEGSYVSISGTWQKNSKETHGPALLIDRKNMRTLAKQSWLDWCAAEMDTVFWANAHHLATSFSWQPGANGAGNPLAYGVWYRAVSLKQSFL